MSIIRLVSLSSIEHVPLSSRCAEGISSDIRMPEGIGRGRSCVSNTARWYPGSSEAGERAMTRLGPDDLILPHMAMVGVEPPMTFHGVPFEDRCRAAAASGAYRR